MLQLMGLQSLSSGDGYFGELLDLQQGYLAWRVEPPGFSRVAAGALELRRRPQGPALVTSGKASPHASC